MSARQRFAMHWRTKVVLAVALGVFFCVPYMLIGRFPLRPVHTLPLNWVDRAVGFELWPWLAVYQSAYLPINLIPWLASRLRELLRYLKGFVLLCAIGFVVFIAFPIQSPRPLTTEPTGMYWLLHQYDSSLNSLPSLHAGLLVYTLCFGRRIFAGNLPKGLAKVCVIWAALILYATLATKQHYFVDIVAGSALGVLAHAWAWRDARSGRSTSTPAPTPAPPRATP